MFYLCIAERHSCVDQKSMESTVCVDWCSFIRCPGNTQAPTIFALLFGNVFIHWCTLKRRWFLIASLLVTMSNYTPLHTWTSTEDINVADRFSNVLTWNWLQYTITQYIYFMLAVTYFTWASELHLSPHTHWAHRLSQDTDCVCSCVPCVCMVIFQQLDTVA